MSISPCPIQDCRTTDPDGNPTLTPDPICPPHHTRLIATLRNLPRTYVEAHLAIGPANSSAATERVTTSKTRPLPINAQARALQEDMVRTVTQIEDAIRYSHHLTDRQSRGREGPTLAGAARFVLLHLDDMLDLEHGIAAAEALLELRRRSDHILGKTNPNRKLPTPCPECGCTALQRRNGEEDVHCQACGKTLTPMHYQTVTETMAAEKAR